jgi:uncharacterized protein YPO0396
MTITTDFEQLNEEKTVAELAIKIRAGMEYTLRVLEEQITSINDSIADVDFSSIPVSIRTEGANIMDDFKTLRDHLNAEHSEFLTI